MAEPNTQPSPPLAAVPDPQAPKPEAESESEPGGRGGAPWWLFAVLALLLVASVWGLVSQTQHSRAQAQEIVSLNGQLGEFEAQLTALSTQVAQFGMQRELVGISVGKLAQQLTDLQSLVAWNPAQLGSKPPGGAAGEAGEAEAPAAASGGPEAAAPEANSPTEPGTLDLDSVPALRPGPSLELAPRDQV